MAQGISTHWRKDGPTSRVSQAAFVAREQRAECVQAATDPNGDQNFCPRHWYRGCPKAA